jgi:hypothetical protein
LSGTWIPEVFIAASRDPIRATPTLRVPDIGHDLELSERQLHARRRVHLAMQALGGTSSPAGSRVWHAVVLQRKLREWALRRGLG